MADTQSDVLMRRILNHLARLERQVAELAQQPRLLHVGPEEVLLAGPDRLHLVFPYGELNHAISWTNPRFDLGLRRSVARHLGAGDCYLDIGANAGVIAALAARSAGPAGQVITVEPLPDLAPIIARNLFLNAPMTPHLHHQAVITEPVSGPEVHIFRHVGDSRVSSLTDPGGTPERLQVPALSLRAVWPEGTAPLLVKIDVEGAEFTVLTQLLELHGETPERPMTVIFEYAPEHLERGGPGPEALAAFLDSHDIAPAMIEPLTGQLGPPLSKGLGRESGNMLFTLGPSRSPDAE